MTANRTTRLDGLHRLLLATLAVTLALSCAANAAVIYVSTSGNDEADGASWASAKRTIQAGIDAAVCGDEVWVAAGTYAERLTHKSGVRLYGGFEGDEDTRDERDFLNCISEIDGQTRGAVVTVPTGADLSTLIDGFTITNGIGASQGNVRYGGGIYALDACVTVENCVIVANAAAQGAGLYCNSEIVLKNNHFKENGSPNCINGGAALLLFGRVAVHGNTFTSNRAVYGGALALAHGSGEVSLNTFLGNSSQVGGGVYNYGLSHPLIRQNTFTGNTAYSGGGVGCNGCRGEVTANLFTGNSALSSGGAVYLVNGATSTVSNNVMTGCVAQSDFGGAVASTRANPSIVNNTMVGNTAARGGGGVAYLESGGGTLSNNIIAFCSSGVYGGTGTQPALRTNAFYQNSEGDFAGVSEGPGNVLADPAFADRAAGDYHLQEGSPCIDAATNTDAPAADFDSTLRPLDGDASGEATADIGAFEAPAAVIVYDMNIGEVKSAFPDGTVVGFKNVVVSACFTELGFIYVQRQDRGAGIRVETTAAVSEGQLVYVAGTLQTVPGQDERSVLSSEVSPVTPETLSNDVLAPVLMAQEYLGGAAFGLQQGVIGCTGLNNIGLLAMVFGKVTFVDPGGQFFTVWDGSRVKDADGHDGVRVWAPGLTLPAVDAFITVTGISSCTRAGETLLPLVRVRSSADIQSLWGSGLPPAP